MYWWKSIPDYLVLCVMMLLSSVQIVIPIWYELLYSENIHLPSLLPTIFFSYVRIVASTSVLCLLMMMSLVEINCVEPILSIKMRHGSCLRSCWQMMCIWSLSLIWRRRKPMISEPAPSEFLIWLIQMIWIVLSREPWR